jgi:hypothetical protein
MLVVAEGLWQAIDHQRAALAHLLAGLGARYSTTELTAAVGGLAGTRRRIPYATGRSALVDIVVHSLDIGVPLGRSIAPPPEVTAIAAAEVAKRLLWPRPSHTLRATDVRWQAGEGPLLEAPIADLLLILTGRRD